MIAWNKLPWDYFSLIHPVKNASKNKDSIQILISGLFSPLSGCHPGTSSKISLSLVCGVSRWSEASGGKEPLSWFTVYNFL
jgi:hypothetical protein